MTQKYIIGISDNNLWIVNRINKTYYKELWGNIISNNDFNSFTNDSNLNQNIINMANQGILSLEDISEDFNLSVKLKINTNFGDLNLPEFSNTLFKDALTRNIDLITENEQLEDLEKRILFISNNL